MLQNDSSFVNIISQVQGKKSLKEHRRQRILVLLGKFGLHARDGSFEEEGNQMLVCSFCADLLEGGDVSCTIFEADDEQGMIGSKEDEVRE